MHHNLRVNFRWPFHMTNLPYYLGCPIWSNKNWIGDFFTKEARPHDFLRQYSSVFNTVEGNTTFYALPKPASVQKWREETPPAFKFCFKFPRMLSHDLRLQNAEEETQVFLRLLAPLAERLGPFFLQLPPTFSRREFFPLTQFLKTLPTEFEYAVEARHPDFFDEGEHEARFNDLLRKHNIARVIFDTRGLHAAQAAPNDPITKDAQRRKPKVPVRFLATNRQPFVRFVGDPIIEKNEALLQQWAKQVVQWLDEGLLPFVFMHAPDDIDAPRVARYFHGLVRALSENTGELPAWPHEKEQHQLQLF